MHQLLLKKEHMVPFPILLTQHQRQKVNILSNEETTGQVWRVKHADEAVVVVVPLVGL